jgi:hypothetical protein
MHFHHATHYREPDPEPALGGSVQAARLREKLENFGQELRRKP